MKIKFWGVRGSLPSSMSPFDWSQHFENLMIDFFRCGFSKASDVSQFIQQQKIPQIGGFGEATTCVQIIDEKQSLIIDGGSGIKKYSDFLIQSRSSQNEFHILLSHFHFDHLLGLPFFGPHFQETCVIHFYAVQSEAEACVRRLFERPMFPVSFDSLNAKIVFHQIQPYEVNLINGFKVQAFQLDHPDQCFGFRVEKNQVAYAHAIDHESVRINHQQLGKDAGLFKKVKLLYFDAQYEEVDMLQKKGWGHGTCDRGFEVAHHFGVQQILFAHHDPSVSLQNSRNQKKKAQELFEKKYINSSLSWDFAYDGQEVELF